MEKKVKGKAKDERSSRLVDLLAHSMKFRSSRYDRQRQPGSAEQEYNGAGVFIQRASEYCF